MPKASELRKGNAVLYDGNLWIVHEATRVAKGNWRSYMQIKLKNFKQGNVVDFRFNMDEKLESPFVEDKQYEYLYRDGDDYVVMDLQTFEQYHVSSELLPDAEKYLKGNEHITCKLMEGKIIGADLPDTVVLEVTDAPPVVKGATATNQNKEVTLETGHVLRVPPFIATGDKVKVDTRTDSYMERA